MSWMQKCAETYENNRHMIGRVIEGKSTLAPPHYTSQQSHIEVTLNSDGTFVTARKTPKEQQETIIPVTEGSAVRTANVEPHPLCEQLGYVALGHPNVSDLEFIMDKEDEKKEKYKGEEGQKKYQEDSTKKCADKYRSYSKLLGKWVSSSHSHFIVNAVYCYVTSGTVLNDLLSTKLLNRGENGLIQIGKAERNSLIRWVVLKEGEIGESWRNSELADSYSEFLAEEEPEESDKNDICYVTGEYTRITTTFPRGISKKDYGAKLLSANEDKETGFTYKGRFFDSAEAFRVGAGVSQKAHAALTWLTANQGKYYGPPKGGGQTYVCWNPRGKEIPAFDADADDLFGGAKEEEADYALTMPEYAERLQKAIAGYKQELGDRDDILILAMEAATTGRMSVTYYNELQSSDYLDRLESWQKECAWYYPVCDVKGIVRKGYLRSPSVKEIINFCFGSEKGEYVNADDRLMKEQSQRIFHCIVNSAPIPRDLVEAITRRASMRIAYKKYKYRDNYELLLFVACALIRAYKNGRSNKNINRKEEWSMELDTQKRDRSYLFGRLLAVAEKVERSAYGADESGREPAAVRLQAAFAAHPVQTWVNIEKSLAPYYAKLKPGSRNYYRALRDEIVSLFKEEDFKNTPLDGSYLLGYCLQRKELNHYNKTQENMENTEEN